MPRIQYDVSTLPKDVGPLGYIEGLRLSHKGKPVLDYFGGLPYALPPVGPFRFRKPRPLAPCYRYGHKGGPGRFNGRTGVCPQPSTKNKSDWDEDCSQLNIYVPAGAPPASGWPVLFYIHGGFLQFGNANEKPEAIAPLLSETAFHCICVMPAYRLNAFGFLASHELAEEAKKLNEPVGNHGFWDQRLALEWTWKNISLFGGDHSRITVAGYSAGAHSAFQQLAHELYFVPDAKAIIKGVIMWSNSPGVQPKTLDEHQKQFDQLLQALQIPLTLSADEKLQKLRRTPSSKIVEALDKIKLTEFRALSDGRFVSHQAMANINNGDFAKRLKARGIRLMIGENRDEHNLYRTWRTPQDSYHGVLTRLNSDYPELVAKRVLQHYCKNGILPNSVKNWQYLFGHIYSDMQVYGLQRGFQNALFKHGLVAGKDIFRYRFERRMKCIDSIFPPEWGVTHATDMAIWFWGLDYADGLTAQETEMLKSWNQGFAAFVKGENVDWSTSKPTDMRRLTADGKTDTWQDDQWEKGLALWNVVNDTPKSEKARL
ncbi:hypothetical protein AMS68_006690 [Peltaster fructicola]|uniref:Carboxylic ester hydrolase n=1 Tax=Peltaster fructicola TaxID=286661 RepID=A0A6H0Y2C4_9PEZI|nr:hypothetical protein AMS68_006690 [Peltaster fructicola]